MRSKLWDASTWPERGELPTMAEMLRDQTKTDVPDESDADMAARYQKELY